MAANLNTLSREAFGVQFITHFTEQYSYLDSVRIALEGGCRWVQLRMKDSPLEEIRKTAIEARKLCSAYNAVFLIDDQVELCREQLCDGIHLGKKDMPIRQARSILGNAPIIGGTANTFEDVQLHYMAGASYIGCGPYRFTTTKKNLAPILGIEGYRSIVKRMRNQGIRLPIVAIGGITAEDIPAIMQTGVNGIALSGSILRAEQPVEEMKKIVETVKQFL